MNILVVGSGGREHALVWKIRQSRKVETVTCAPGNAGIAGLAACVDIKPTDIDALLQFALSHDIGLTVVGPEQPLTEGIVDLFEREGLHIFGPSKAAAELEGSKTFAKRFMEKHNVPTAAFGVFANTQIGEAIGFIHGRNFPVVVKADGLAGGKGVVICETEDEASHTVESMMGRNMFGAAGSHIVVEEYLEGEEMSVFVLTDGKDYLLFPTAQDHKRILDGDRGKNTGGMGAYAPAPAGSPSLMREIEQIIIKPTIDGMMREGRRYAGCLYAGLMLTADGPKVLEYNCRFGDPEAQVVLPLVDNDIVELFLACVTGGVGRTEVRLKNACAACVVMASAGYPDSSESGRTIAGLDAPFEDGVTVFHAGTKRANGDIVTSGGRVLGVTAVGSGTDLQATVDQAYRAVSCISFTGAQYRKDIGKKGVERLRRSGLLEEK